MDFSLIVSCLYFLLILSLFFEICSHVPEAFYWTVYWCFIMDFRQLWSQILLDERLLFPSRYSSYLLSSFSSPAWFSCHLLVNHDMDLESQKAGYLIKPRNESYRFEKKSKIKQKMIPKEIRK